MNQSGIKKIVKHIPVFHGLTDDQVQKLADLCSERDYAAGQTVCKADDESSEIFVVTKGNLAINSPFGVELANVKPLGIVGEMGVLTGGTRSAGVVATQDTKVLFITKNHLDQIIETDKDAGLSIYRNFINILCDRLRENNIFLEQYHLIVEDLADLPGDE